jgi:hypothetical protein
MNVDSSHIVSDIGTSHVESAKPDYFDCDFIHQTLSVCGAINVSLDSVKNEIKKATKFRALVKTDDMIRFSSQDFISDLQIPEKSQNQGFWKRYSGQKMDSKNQMLALNFEASKSSGQILCLRDELAFPKNLPVNAQIPHKSICLPSFNANISADGISQSRYKQDGSKHA